PPPPRAARAGLPDPRVETALAAAADAGSPAHVGARGSRVPSSAPICTGARPAEPDGRAPDRRTTRPRQPPESGKAEAIDVRAEPALRARIEFLNPTGFDSQQRFDDRALGVLDIHRRRPLLPPREDRERGIPRLRMERRRERRP